jgi:tripartite-type tricarboxylate transporter receptor subunit TctC
VVERISRDVARILVEPEFREREVVGKGYTSVGSTPEEFAAFVRSDLEYKGRLIRVSGVKAD